MSGQLLYSLLSGGHYAIAGLDLSSGTLTSLSVPGTADDMNPQVSPDQRYAVFYSNRDGDQEIWRLDLVDLSVTQLTFNTASDYDPSYSPDGSKIVFKSNRDDGYGDIFIMNADGSGQVNLTAGRSTSEDWDPVFSPDGSKIYFVSRLTIGDPSSDEIFVMNADGSNVQRLTNNAVPDWYPAVDSVTGRMAFVSKSAPASDDDLFVINADGSGRTQLTTGNGDEGDPAWSPDGGRLVFVRWNGSAYETYIANADGSAATLAPPQSGQQLGPCWWTPLPATFTPTPSASPSFSPTTTPSATLTLTDTPGIVASLTATPTQTVALPPPPSSTKTRTASPTLTPLPIASPTPPGATATLTSTLVPAVAIGPLEILEAWPVPNPDPVELRFKLAGPTERVTLRLWTPNFVCVGRLEGGPYAAGWQSLAIPATTLASAPLGLLYYTVAAELGGRKSPRRAPGRFVRLR